MNYKNVIVPTGKLARGSKRLCEQDLVFPSCPLLLEDFLSCCSTKTKQPERERKILVDWNYQRRLPKGDEISGGA